MLNSVSEGNIDSCDQVFINMNGSFLCSCISGHSLSDDQTSILSARGINVHQQMKVNCMVVSCSHVKLFSSSLWLLPQVWLTVIEFAAGIVCLVVAKTIRATR